MMKLKRLFRPLGATMLIALLVVGVIQSITPAQDSKEKSPETVKNNQDDPNPRDGRPVSDLRHFMRGKLAASNKILEGLTTEDMALVREGSRALNKMSLSEKWRVNNDGIYKQFSAEFRRITNGLNTAAEEENLDQAALKWMGATMTCIECHRFVRNTLVVDRRGFE